MTNSSTSNHVAGLLQRAPGGGRLRQADVSFLAQPDDVLVPTSMMKELGIVEGATVSGTFRTVRHGNELIDVETICGLDAATFRKRIPFEKLVAVKPFERFNLSVSKVPAMRIVDLIAPIGKGTRGLIVAPPKSGKTILLEQMAQAIHASNPDTRIILLLIDERPEEVTHFRRTLNAEVFASSNDQRTHDHVALTELMMGHMRVELECGRDVVVLVDSLTRMARAFNLHGTGSHKTLSGGVDAGALEMPRRFLGLARKIENGGSITILATALVETNSRMDDLIYQEFKGTGNSELILNRDLAEKRIYPALNLLSSSTRNDELFFSSDEMTKLAKLRRWLAGGNPQTAMVGLLKLIEQTKTNDELLRRIRAGSKE